MGVSLSLVFCNANFGDNSANADERAGIEQASMLNDHLRAGEFVAAKKIAGQSLPTARDRVLAQVASAQRESGYSTAAAATLREIDSPASRESAMDGQGGSSFADFQSLIDLIQTTVVPDTWEALGGPSTMSEYPQGILVDSQGTVRENPVLMDVDEAENLRVLLSGGSADFANASQESSQWRSPSKLRFVSLKRLRDQIASSRMQGAPASIETRYLAGLSRVQYVMIGDDDVILVGPVGGIEDFQGWYRDAVTKLHVLRSDFFFTCIASALSQRPFGCSIDPTTEGLRQTARLAADVKGGRVPLGQAAERMKDALGMQRVEVFGTPADTAIGYLMVESDRHMKQLALGERALPQPAKSYLDMVDAMIDQGTPDDLLLRLWFTSAKCNVRSDIDKRVFELAGVPVRLSGQNERAVASGERGHHAVDPRTQAFVTDFNRNWGSIRQKYPIYASLESIYRCASVAEILHRYASSDLKGGLLASFAAESSSPSQFMPAPRQVESIATLHTVRHGRTRHHVLLASGGVAVDPRQTVVEDVPVYPSLDSIADPVQDQPTLIQRWWWDAERLQHPR
tara:strand:- start:191105 stop:192814 length:1710 start_codon:yes stop_codon:yes gene_type:complete